MKNILLFCIISHNCIFFFLVVFSPYSYLFLRAYPISFENCKVLLLNVELELKSEKENAEVRISDPSMYQSIVDAEWSIIYDKLDKCVASGAQIILSKLPIGDLATQYFADRGLFCAGRVEGPDMERVAKVRRRWGWELIDGVDLGFGGGQSMV